MAAQADFSFEAALAGRVAGVDEAGRGPLAGPVVAAAVVFADRHTPAGVADSKALSVAARARLALAIRETADVGVGVAEPDEIDRLNIHHATLAAMARSLAALSAPPDAILVDGLHVPALARPIPSRALVKGDARSLSIAAASIIAKTVRDALMKEAEARWPGYGFARHAGYPTAHHRAALTALGPCPLHRRSFAPVRAASVLLRCR